MHQDDNVCGMVAHVLARAVAVVGAFGWGVVFFGVTDLLVPVLSDRDFYDSYLLETGWGLLFAVFVAAPLIALAARPHRTGPTAQLVAASVAVAVPAALTPAPAQLLPAVGLLATAGLQRRLAKRTIGGDRAIGGDVHALRTRPGVLRSWALVTMAGIAAVPYAATMISAGRAGQYPVDVTWGLDHWPMQAALAICFPAGATVAALRLPGWHVAAWTTVASAIWLGAMSFAYPQQAGSLGHAWGAACVAWGVILAADTLLPVRARRH